MRFAANEICGPRVGEILVYCARYVGRRLYCLGDCIVEVEIQGLFLSERKNSLKSD